MIYGYIRVSTDKQSVENQRFEINKFTKKTNCKVDEWIEETVSGTVSPKKRNLGKLIEKAKEGDTIICSEISSQWKKSVNTAVIIKYRIIAGI